MSDLLQTMTTSASGMTAQSARLRVLTENIANADTPGYQRKMIPFRQVMLDTGTSRIPTVAAGRMTLSQTELTQIYDPAHPLAGADGMYEGSNVNMLVELADAREAQRSYEANLKMFDQARKMTASVLDLLRR